MASSQDDSPSSRPRSSSGLGGFISNVGGFIGRTAEAAGTLLSDADLRRQGVKVISGGASKGFGVIQTGLQTGANTIKTGFLTVGRGPRQIQSVLVRLGQQLEERRTARLLEEQRDAPTDVQVGFQVFEDAAQELRSRLWMAYLERPELVEKYRELTKEHWKSKQGHVEEKKIDSQGNTEVEEAGSSGTKEGKERGPSPMTPKNDQPSPTSEQQPPSPHHDQEKEDASWQLVNDRGATRFLQGRRLLSGGSFHRAEPWSNALEAFRQDLMTAMSSITWPLPTEYPPDCRYATLLQISIGQEDIDDVIARDIHRTFPEYPLFGISQTGGQQALFRVLKAYSLHDLEVGYCQGMAFVAGLGLFFLPEEPAYQTFCRLLAETGPNLRRFYLPGLHGLKVSLRVFDILLARYLPNLKAHLEAAGAVTVLFAAQWFLSAFSCPFPVGFACRLIDVMLAENSSNILYRISLAVMAECEAELLVQEDFEELLTYLKVEPVQWEVHRLRRVLNAAIFQSPIGDEELAEVLGMAEKEETLATAPLGGAVAAAGVVLKNATSQNGSENKEDERQGNIVEIEQGEEGLCEPDDVAFIAQQQNELETAYRDMVLDLDMKWNTGDDEIGET